MRHINAQLAQELQVRLPQVGAAVQLLDEGASVRVRALEVDLARKRIALSMKKDPAIDAQPGANRFEARRARAAPQVAAPCAMASACARLKA